MTKRGFSLIELLIVVAIIMALYAIMHPVFMQAKVASTKSVCQSNLRQQYLALELYREAVGGIDSPAPSYTMGFPPFFSSPNLVPVLGDGAKGAGELTCGSPRGYPTGQRDADYVAFWPNATPDVTTGTGQLEGDQKLWIDFVESMGPKTIVIVDPNHQSHWPVSSYSNQFAMGITISGGLVVKVKRGSCLTMPWWER